MNPIRVPTRPGRPFGPPAAVRLLAVLTLALLGASACSPAGGTDDATSRAVPDQRPGADLQTVPGVVWVTNRAQHDVTAFDAGTGAAIATIPVGRNPIEVVAPRSVRKVYVSNEDSNTVSVISKDSLTSVDDIRIPTEGSRPHHMAPSPDGRFVYAAGFGSNTVVVIDAATDKVVDEHEAGATGAGTHAVAVAPNGKTLYAVNSGSDQVVAMDAQTGAHQWTLAVGDNPSELLVTPGGIGYLSIRGEHKVVVVDLIGPSVIAEIRVGTQPDTMQLTNDGRTLVVALRGSPAQVALASTDDFTHVRTVQLDGRTTGHQSLSPNGRYTFVAVEGDVGQPGTLGVIDNRTGETLTQHVYPAAPPAAARPHGVVHDADAVRVGKN